MISLRFYEDFISSGVIVYDKTWILSILIFSQHVFAVELSVVCKNLCVSFPGLFLAVKLIQELFITNLISLCLIFTFHLIIILSIFLLFFIRLINRIEVKLVDHRRSFQLFTVFESWYRNRWYLIGDLMYSIHPFIFINCFYKGLTFMNFFLSCLHFFYIFWRCWLLWGR